MMRLGELCTVVGEVGAYAIREYLPTDTGELMVRVEAVGPDCSIPGDTWTRADRLRAKRRGACEFCPAIGGGCIVCEEGQTDV